MLYRQRELRNLVAQLLDCILLGVSFWLAHSVRFYMGEKGWFEAPPIQSLDQFFPLLVFVMILGPLILDGRRIYRETMLDVFHFFFVRLAQGLLLILALMVLLIYLFKMGSLARGVILLFTPLAFVMVSARHLFMQRLNLPFLHEGAGPPSVLLVGDVSATRKFQKMLEGEGEMNLRILAAIHDMEHLEKQVSDWLYKEPVAGVVFAVSRADFDGIQKALHVCELEGVEAWVVTDYLQTQLARPFFVHVQNHPVLVFAPRGIPGWQVVAKRVMDFTVALIGLVVMFIPMLLIALWIRLESPGPSIFVQERSGQRGRMFRMYKFRSMTSDAAMKQEELEKFNEMTGPVFKISNDPRITRFGSFLRRTSLDELPQLWNVLCGEMSLVGPRPLPVYETQRILDWAHRRRLSIRPGLTCLWQISGRNRIRKFDDWVRLDLEYVDNRSLWLDLKILVKTIPVVLSGWGAK